MGKTGTIVRELLVGEGVVNNKRSLDVVVLVDSRSLVVSLMDDEVVVLMLRNTEKLVDVERSAVLFEVVVDVVLTTASEVIVVFNVSLVIIMLLMLVVMFAAIVTFEVIVLFPPIGNIVAFVPSKGSIVVVAFRVTFKGGKKGVTDAVTFAVKVPLVSPTKDVVNVVVVSNTVEDNCVVVLTVVSTNTVSVVVVVALACNAVMEGF